MTAWQEQQKKEEKGEAKEDGERRHTHRQHIRAQRRRRAAVSADLNMDVR